MQYSPLLNESQSSVWTALNDPYHAPVHLYDQEEGDDSGPNHKLKSSKRVRKD